jgi:WD40 repeat protein
MKDPQRTRGSHARLWTALTVFLALASTPDCLAAQPRFSVPCSSWVGAVAYSSDGKLLAVGSADGATRLLQAKDVRELAVLRWHTDAVASVAFTPDGKGLVSGSFDQTACLWDVQSAKLRMPLRGHRGAVMSVTVSPDGKTLATASIDTSIKLWDSSTGELRATLLGHKSWVNSIVFGADGKTLLSASSDGTVKIWDTTPGQAVITLEATTAAERTPAEVRSVALSPDGKTIAAGLRYGWVKLWTAPAWDQSSSFKAHDADVWAVVFNPKRSVLITGDGDWNRPGQVKFWDTMTQAPLAHYPTSGEVLALACSPEGRQVAVGCWNKQLEVWDVPEVMPARE